MPDDPIRARLDEIGQRADAATIGPWTAYTDQHGRRGVAGSATVEPTSRADVGCSATVNGDVVQAHDAERASAAFIAAARTDVPQLVAALRAVLDLADDLEATLAQIVDDARDECPEAVDIAEVGAVLGRDHRGLYRQRIAAALNPHQQETHDA